MKMKKLISLGVVSAMVASMASVAFATIEKTGYNLNNLQAFVLKGDAVSTVNVASKTLTSQTINGVAFTNVIYLTGKNTDQMKVVFGLSNTCLFGAYKAKPASQEVVPAATASGIKKASEGSFTNRGVTFATGSVKTNAGFGEYSGTAGLTVNFTNSSTSDQYASQTITLTDNAGATKTFTVVTKASALDKDDTSAADVDTNDEGYKDYADGAKLKNGSAIFPATLKDMVGKGKYCFYGEKGVNILAQISQATVNAGKTAFNATLAADSTLTARYNANGQGMILRLTSNFLPLESRQVNIDCDNSKVVDILTSDFADKVVNGSVKRFYVYPITQAGYDSLANASGNDGLIDTNKVISGTVSGSKMVFTLPKDVTDVMISLKELDTASLPAIPGVSIATSTAANEITAPVIADTTSIVAPSVVSAPVIATAPAAKNAGQQNTGASDVVVLAIALAAISMVAAGAVAVKKSI